jgi:inosine triphosphate pyrophosphatase
MAAIGLDGLNNLVKGFIDPSTGQPDTRAWALSTFAYSAGPGSEPILFEGRMDGHIVPARGDMKFGWDPTFQPIEGGGKTYVTAPSPSNLLMMLQLC